MQHLSVASIGRHEYSPLLMFLFTLYLITIITTLGCKIYFLIEDGLQSWQRCLESWDMLLRAMRRRETTPAAAVSPGGLVRSRH